MIRWLVPLLLVASWTVTIAILVTPEPATGFSIPHDPVHLQGRDVELPRMEQGGDSSQRHADTLVLGWLFGSLLIATFGGLMTWSSQVRCRSLMGVLLVGSTLVTEAAFSAMCWNYHRQPNDPSDISFFGLFPASTAWQLYGVGLVPFLFVGIYVGFFRRQILTHEAAAEFSRLSNSSR